MTTAATLDHFRHEFPALERQLYLNFAGVAPCPTRVVHAVTSWLADLTEYGLLHEPSWEPTATQVRARCAALIGPGVGTDEIAFVRNTSHGLGLVAEGLDWRPGDEVAVCTSIEYPSNVYPWLHLADRGVVLREIAARNGGVEADEVARVLGPRTRLLAVSSVQFASGHVTDLAQLGEMCARAGILFCVDGIQSVGCTPLDVKKAGVHFLSADSHKWMVGMPGVGFLFVNRVVLHRLRPVLVGWHSTVDAWNFNRTHFELRADAARFEEGSSCYAALAGMGAAAGLLLEAGLPAIAAAIAERLEVLDRGLRQLGCDVSPGPGQRAGILTFSPPGGDVARMAGGLAARGASVSLRRGRIRVAPHFVNTLDEMHRFVALVADQLRTGG
jgi:selenocysteine lyase/cysteine desulfurase